MLLTSHKAIQIFTAAKLWHTYIITGIVYWWRVIVCEYEEISYIIMKYPSEISWCTTGIPVLHYSLPHPAFSIQSRICRKRWISLHQYLFTTSLRLMRVEISNGRAKKEIVDKCGIANVGHFSWIEQEEEFNQLKGQHKTTDWSSVKYYQVLYIDRKRQ